MGEETYVDRTTERYWLCMDGLWRQVIRDEYIRAERAAGFRPEIGNGIARGIFDTGSVKGRVTYGDILEENYGHDPEFFAAARTLA